jgi:hypothetical protein
MVKKMRYKSLDGLIDFLLMKNLALDRYKIIFFEGTFEAVLQKDRIQEKYIDCIIGYIGGNKKVYSRKDIVEEMKAMVTTDMEEEEKEKENMIKKIAKFFEKER